MKRLLLASTLTASLFFAPTTNDASILKDDNVLTISPNHTFTITFSDDVKKNEALIEEITILTTASPVTFTPAISGNTMTLDPTKDLEQNEAYTVEVKLKNEKPKKQTFFTTSTVKTPISTFIEQYPQYKDATIITTMQEQSEEHAYLLSIGEQPSSALAKAVKDIPANINSLKTLIQQIDNTIKNAEAISKSATANEEYVEMQLDTLRDMASTHITDAPSLHALTKTNSARENIISLMHATQKASDIGLDLITALEDLNSAISDIYLVAPSSQPNMHYVNSLQTSFQQNLSNVAVSESTITKQIDAIDALLENATDYTYLLDEVSAFVQDVQLVQQQFDSWKNATDIPNVIATYPTLQQMLLNVNNIIATTSNIDTIEQTLSIATDTVENIKINIPEYIDAYLESKVEYLLTALEQAEEAADAKELDYIYTDQYIDADEAVRNVEVAYSFYDETMTYDKLQADFKDAHDKIHALKITLGI